LRTAVRRQRSTIQNDAQAAQPQGFLLPGYAGTTPPTLWDHPYDTSAVMPKRADNSQAGKKVLALVDYDNVIYGDAKEYSISISDQATILDVDNQTSLSMFQQNMTAIKVWGLVDIQLANPTKAFGALATSAS
jgi:HK97 family phage major capsid protein